MSGNKRHADLSLIVLAMKCLLHKSYGGLLVWVGKHSRKFISMFKQTKFQNHLNTTNVVSNDRTSCPCSLWLIYIYALDTGFRSWSDQVWISKLCSLWPLGEIQFMLDCSSQLLKDRNMIVLTMWVPDFPINVLQKGVKVQDLAHYLYHQIFFTKMCILLGWNWFPNTQCGCWTGWCSVGISCPEMRHLNPNPKYLKCKKSNQEK